VITTKLFKLEGDQALRHQAMDQLRLKSVWRGGQEFSSLHGRIVRLRFHLKNAVIYSFQALPASN
jgi:hypothetical protein